MLPKKYYNLIVSASMSIIMGGIMSGIVTAVNTGLDANYIYRWLSAFAMVTPIAFVVMQFLRPLTTKIASALTEP